MYASRNEYDRGVNTFSPEGRLFQVEYALGAVKLGSTAVGVRCPHGVVLATEKRLQSTMIEPSKGDMQKILEIDSHCGCASSGIIADARTLIDHGRVEAANFFFTYNEKITVESVVAAISDLALDFSGVHDGDRKKVMSRPFGTALLIGGVDKTGPHLWTTDASGTNTEYSAAAIGSAHEGAESLLLERYREDMSYAETEELALDVLRQGMEEKLSTNNVEVACVKTESGKFEVYTREQIDAVLARLPERPEI